MISCIRSTGNWGEIRFPLFKKRREGTSTISLQKSRKLSCRLAVIRIVRLLLPYASYSRYSTSSRSPLILIPITRFPDF